MTKPAGEVLRRCDYVIADVDQSTARDLVERFHYARGGSNTGVFRHGLFHRSDLSTALGVAWWIPPTRTAAESVAGEGWRGVINLSRLVVAPDVPTNAASFLMAASLRAIRRDPRWTHALTYADEGQGHTGAIYRATNWQCAGTRHGDPVYIDPSTGRHVARKAGGRTRTDGEMKALGYINTGRTRKIKFVLALRRQAAEAAHSHKEQPDAGE